MLRSDHATSNTQLLRDKALYLIEVTTLYWNPFLSVGGERGGRHSKVGDISQKIKSIKSRRFSLPQAPINSSGVLHFHPSLLVPSH